MSSDRRHDTAAASSVANGIDAHGPAPIDETPSRRKHSRAKDEAAERSPEPMLLTEVASAPTPLETAASPAAQSVPADGIERAASETGTGAARRATWGVVQRTRESFAKLDELRDEAARSRLGRGMKMASAKAGVTGAKAGQSALDAGKRGLSAAGEVSKDVLLPAALRLAQRIAARFHPARLAADWRGLLAFLHRVLFDRRFERLMFRPTAKPVALDTLTVQGRRRADGLGYRPTPVLVFDWALSAIREDLDRLGFIDYGAGKGRVLLLASLRPFRQIGGIEFARELHDDAAMNIAQFPRSLMRCRDVECVQEDATRLIIPDWPAVHYFFRLFNRVAFAEILNGLVASYRERPRPLYIVLVDSPDGDLVLRSRAFERAPLPLANRIKAGLFSPYRIEVFRSRDVA